jgi:hypothetical protein
MTVCPWTGMIFQPTKKNQRFSTPAAKTAYHAAARDLGQMIAGSFPPGLLREWVLRRNEETLDKIWGSDDEGS